MSHPRAGGSRRPRPLVLAFVVGLVLLHAVLAIREGGWGLWGGPVRPARVLVLDLYGPPCAPCAKKLEQQLMRVPHVLSVSIDDRYERAQVGLSVSHPDPGPLIEAARRVGYQATVLKL